MAALVATLIACGEGQRADPPDAADVLDDTDELDGAGDDAHWAIAELGVEPVCNAGTSWERGTAAFREATVEWGLEGVEGTRLSVADIDGDGWPDVIVRRGGALANNYASDERNIWLLRNTGEGRFEDVTRNSGIDDGRQRPDDRGRAFEVAVFGDVDNDGDLDAYTGLATFDRAVARGDTSEVMLNSGDGRFSLTAPDSDARRVGAVDVPAGATFVDFDRDGFLDLWVTQQSHEPDAGGIVFNQDRLYRGRGDGTFVDVTDTVGVTTLDWGAPAALNEARSHTRAWSSTACDLNGDGVPELLAASYGRSPNHLWQGARGVDGATTYTNRSVASGYAYDNDLGWTDNEFARCYCAANPDAEGCAGLEAPVVECRDAWNHTFDREPFRLGGNSGTTVCADLDNDGAFDLLTTEIRHWWAGSGADGTNLLMNTGESDVRFDLETRRELRGLVVRRVLSPSWDEGHMTAAVFDFDNDGWPDIYIGASDYPGQFGMLFRQSEPGFFTEVPPGDGIDHNRSHGVVVADFDRDGDLDVLVGHSRARCAPTLPNDCYPTMQVRLFENILGDAGNWVQLRLEGGAGTNRAAIGARVEVSTDGVTQTQEVGGGHGHLGMQNDLVLHFGLGSACEADVRVRWPDADLSEQRFRVVSGHRFHVRQSEPPIPIPRP